MPAESSPDPPGSPFLRGGGTRERLSPEKYLLAALVIVFSVSTAWRQGVPQIADKPNNDRPILALDTGRHNAVYELLVSGYKDQLIVQQRVQELSKGQQFPLIERPAGVESFPLAKPK